VPVCSSAFCIDGHGFAPAFTFLGLFLTVSLCMRIALATTKTTAISECLAIVRILLAMATMRVPIVTNLASYGTWLSTRSAETCTVLLYKDSLSVASQVKKSAIKNQPNKISAFSKEKQNQQAVPFCRTGHIYRISRHTGVH
jgi:hypothetical protein